MTDNFKRTPIAEGVRRAFAGPIPSRLYTALDSWILQPPLVVGFRLNLPRGWRV